jgi:hypothetical protein
VDPRAGLDDMEKKIFLTLLGLEIHPSVVQPVTSLYTDYAIPALEKTEILGENLPQCHFVHHKSHMT